MGLLQKPVTIENLTDCIVVNGAGKNQVVFAKGDYSVTTAGNNGQLISIQQDKVIAAFYFENVTNPVAATPEALVALLNEYSTGGVERPPISLVATTNGSVPESKAVSFTFSSDFVGTVNGVARIAGTSLNFASENNDSVASIPYTVSVGSVIIDYFAV